jgi:DtxR family transcriptional regulator, Mn-dependent transcriptional regulator
MAKIPKGSLSGNMEDYLEAILCIGEHQAAVRVRDIAKRMDITMPSVSGALKNLERQGLVRHPKYDWIDLTDEGRRVAAEVFNRHQVIRGFLTDVLEIDPKTAERDACGMEHTISAVTLERLVRFMKTRPRPARKKGGPA